MMWPSEKMKFSPYVIISILLFIFINTSECILSDKRLCGDPECLKPVSTGRTLVDYPSGDNDILSFRKNNKVLVFSKSAGTREDLWGVEINGVRGYVPKRFVREDKILKKQLDFIVDILPNLTKDNEEKLHSSMNENSEQEQKKDTEEKVLLVETENLQVNPVKIEVLTDPDIVVKNIEPQSTNYEIIGDTTIYFSEDVNELRNKQDEKSKITNLDSTKNINSPTLKVISESPTADKESIENLVEGVVNKANENADSENMDLKPADGKALVNESKMQLEIENTTYSNNENTVTNLVETDIKQDLVARQINVNTENFNKTDINVELNESPKLNDVNQYLVNEDFDSKAQILTDPQLKSDDNTYSEKVLYEDENKIKEINAENIKIVKREIPNEKVNILIQENVEVKKESGDSKEQNNSTKSVNDEKTSQLIDETLQSIKYDEVMNDHQEQEKTVEFVNAENEVKVTDNILELGKNDEFIKDNIQELMSNKTNTLENNSLPPMNIELIETATEPSLPLTDTSSHSGILFAKAEEIPIKNFQLPLSQSKSDIPLTESILSDNSIENSEENNSIKGNSDKLNANIGILNVEHSSESTELPTTSEMPLNIVKDSYSQTNDLYKNDDSPNFNIVNEDNQNNLESTKVLSDSSLKEIDGDINNLKESLKLLQEENYPPFKKFSNDEVLAETIDNLNKNYDSKGKTESLYNTKDIPVNIKQPIGTVEEIKYDAPKEINNELNDESLKVIETDSNDYGIFDSLYNLLFTSSQANVAGTSDAEIVKNQFENNDAIDEGLLSHTSKDKETCSAEHCHASDFIDLHGENFTKGFVQELVSQSGSTVIYLSVTSVTVLFFTLGYYFIEKWRQDGSLLRKVNTLEQALMVSSKECEILKENLEATQTKLKSIKDGAFGSNEEVQALQEEKKKLELTILDKEKQFLDLQKEFEAATETGLELNKMLQDMMVTAQKGDNIAESMEHAQMQLNEQKETINSMSAALATRNKENNSLQLKIKEYEMKIDTIQKVLQQEKSTIEFMKEEKLIMQDQLNSVKDELAKLKEGNSYELQQVRSVLSETQRDLYAKTNQVQLLEDCIKKLKTGSTIEVNDLAKIAELQSDLQRLTSELESLKEHDMQESVIKKKMEENIKALTNEIAIVKEELHKAEKDKMEAQTRLEVLSGYFKEKETQLQKELGIQEALWQQKQGEATSTVERLHSMQDEIQSLKSQNESLHMEIEQQAAAHRTQVTALESRVHEAWLNSRQTQRKLEESRQEASALRRKLTSLVEQENMQKRASSPLEVQLSATSPIHMNSAVSPILPPPPLPFLPPPFLPPPIGNHAPPPPHFIPPFMGDMRPPPLGRLPSPPRQRRGHYSPSLASERYSPESRAYSPESRAFSPDSRAYSPDYRRPISPYDTETDISPPASPYRSKYNSYTNRRNETKKLSKGMASAESNETINRNGRTHTTKAV